MSDSLAAELGVCPPVLCSSSWHCQAQLVSVLKLSGAGCPVQEEEQPSREHFVYLEQPSPPEEDPACILSLRCAAQGKDHILSVTICSEARTIEVYGGSQDGQEEEYLGTGRGERFCTLACEGEDSPVILYKTHLKFQFPVPSCTVKLLSLGGRCSVLLSEISVQMTPVPERCPQVPCFPGPSINLDRVQSIMDSMGGKMSPGAEQLMSMVRAQQKHQAPFGAHFMQLFGSFQPGRNPITEEAKQHTVLPGTVPEAKMENQGQTSAPHPSVQLASPGNDVKSIMSSLLQSSLGPAASSSGPDSLVPLLRNLCGENQQESFLALKEEKTDSSLEKLLSGHMERMEKTLMAHIDERMRSLQEHLDTRLDQLIHLMQGNSISENPAEKLVNGQCEHGQPPGHDAGEWSLN